MKAISLWQPWASAIPLGLKRIETRHWQTKHRGLIAIHAAKRWTPEQRELAERYNLRDLPFGQVIAVARLTYILPTEWLGLVIDETERAFGIYDPRRFGWLLCDIRPITPFNWRGGQGIFNVPDELL